ncbi:uncharacterized protein LOC127242222 [Andrographis paniculata]|uniref:uncharacterized protein LOC127242222 n=1 Tax=Andrographis paniculata TaxID=175694 RepID=UPI0021E86769|nr:uncharacterized protein LOC127242222 [Andrographis paniculata]XP_051117640.1 uncharacterized protein LOC127242222 [Andrographis paniculata]
MNSSSTKWAKMKMKMKMKEGKFVKFMRLPLKLLARARDLYVGSLTGCAGHVAYGNAVIGCPAPHFSTLPRARSFSASSRDDDDLRELIRIASARNLAGKFEAEIFREKEPPLRPGMPRSRTIVIGRIDEERVCEFGENDVVTRSRSYAASRTGSGPVRSALFGN